MDKRPTLKELNDRLLPRLAPYWKSFCIAADFDSDGTTLSSIESTYRRPEECCREVLIQLVRDKKPTWRTVIDCLKSTRCGQLTKDVEAFVITPLESDHPHSDHSSAVIRSVAADDGDTENGGSPKYPMELIDDLAATYSKSLKEPSNEEEFKKDAADKVNVVIQSCNDAEYYAALPRLTEPVKYPSSKSIVVGKFAGWNAAIVRTGKGNKFRNDLKEILRLFPNTNYLLGLGVCMGIKQKFGDVLVGQMIQIEENLKLQNGRLVLRGTRENVKETMKDVFCDDTRGWKRFECTAAAEDSEARTSQVYTGCILSSSLLLNDEGTKQGLEEETQGIIGAEMEGWIAFEDFKSTGRKSITIKGVSDYGDGKKSDDWQLTAAKAAVDYAHFKLESAYLPIVKNIV